jgi:steroid 5-alpha reductase family enzyme
VPLTILNSPAVSRVEGNWGGAHVSFGTARDIVGVILWAIGFGVEALADIQKYTFKQSKPPQGAITDKGLWGLCRRPNYFGEIVHWLGIYLLCISPASSPDISRRGHDALLGSVVSPLFTFCLLMFLSGVPLVSRSSPHLHASR